MFKKKLELIFLSIIFVAIVVLAKNYYDSYTFNKNDISDEYKQLISDKETQILALMQKHYGYTFKVPIIVTNKFQGKLFGLTSYRDGNIKIYLNKKVMRESMHYIIDSVIAHEYAHALMFKKAYLRSIKNAHSKQWMDTCLNLGALNCEKYVNQNEVIMAKMPF
ncbi:MAG: sprT domain-containing protein [Sulfurimonas sp.]|nr:MAG: sprT domain-containing protein [Sulfurimonas sp.]